MKSNKINCLAAFSASLLLLGCSASAPELSEADALVPSGWSTDFPLVLNKAALREDFWKDWNDPELLELVERVEEANVDVGAARAAIASAAASLRAATSSLFPGAEASASSVENSSEADHSEAGLSGSWTLNLFGGDYWERDAAQAALEAAKLSLFDLKEIAKSQAAQAYVNLRFSQKKLEVLLDSIESLKKTLDAAVWLEGCGLGSRSDVLEAQRELASRSADVPEVQKSILQYKNAIAVLAAKRLDEVDYPWSGEVPAAPEGAAALIPAEALRNRPDVRAAEYKILEAHSRLKAAKAKYFPVFSLNGNLAARAASFGALGGSGAASLTAGVSIPILNWGEISAGVDEGEAQLQKAVEEYKSAILSALEQVDNAVSGIRAAEARHEDLTAAMASAAEAERLLEMEYEAGIGSYQDLLIAQRSLYSAQDAYYANLGERAVQIVVLHQALGGDWRAEDSSKENKK